jgi:hypothetical protein
MTNDSPRFGAHTIDTTICGHETDGRICGQPTVLWVILDGHDWRDHQATACAQHAAQLAAYPGARITSDAEITYDDLDAVR